MECTLLSCPPPTHTHLTVPSAPPSNVAATAGDLQEIVVTWQVSCPLHHVQNYCLRLALPSLSGSKRFGGVEPPRSHVKLLIVSVPSVVQWFKEVQ